jgi:anti-anti-sigma factor
MAMQRGPHWLEREDLDGVTVVRVLPSGLLDEDLCREVFGMLHALVSEVGRARLVLDLSRVQLLDSNAVGKLVMLNRETEAHGGRLALCSLAGSTAELFEKMHLSSTFAIYSSVAEAVSSFPPADLFPDFNPVED